MGDNKLGSQSNKQKKSTYPARNDNSGDDRNESSISKPSLPLQGHQISKNRREKWRRRSNSLVERDRQIPKRNVAKHNGDAEDKAKSRDLKELDARSNGLQRNHLKPSNCNVAEQRTSGHVAHGEEDRVLKTIVGEQILVEQQNPNVGRVPGGNEADREETTHTLHFGRWVLIKKL